MALIKQASWSPANHEPVAMHLGDLKAQAAMVESEAARNAAAILDAARLQRDKILAGAKEQGHREGFDKGRAEGLAKGITEGRAQGVAESKSRLADIEARWASGAAEFEVARDRMLTEARQDLIRLSLRIAERVIKRRIDTDPNIAAAQLEAVLGMILRPSKLVIVINPDDAPTLRDAMPSLMSRFSAAQHLELVNDPSLPRGSCIARTSGGEIDASLWTQLDRIAETLLCGGLTHDSAAAKPASDGSVA